jgi:hypothetical protein
MLWQGSQSSAILLKLQPHAPHQGGDMQGKDHSLSVHPPFAFLFSPKFSFLERKYVNMIVHSLLPSKYQLHWPNGYSFCTFNLMIYLILQAALMVGKYHYLKCNKICSLVIIRVLLLWAHVLTLFPTGQAAIETQIMDENCGHLLNPKFRTWIYRKPRFFWSSVIWGVW